MYMYMSTTLPVDTRFTADTTTFDAQSTAPVALWSHQNYLHDVLHHCTYDILVHEYDIYLASHVYYERLCVYIPHVMHALKKIKHNNETLAHNLNTHMVAWQAHKSTVRCTPQENVLLRAYADYQRSCKLGL